MTSLTADLVDRLDHFQRRVIQDAMAQGTAHYWRRRAQALRDARPRPTDFHGESTLEQRRDRWRRLTQIADACDAHARLFEAA